MHLFIPESSGIPSVVDRQNGTLEDRDPFILISVGAKRVVTAWKQIITMSNERVGTICSKIDKKKEKNFTGSSRATMSSFSFQWLSSDMPFKQANYTKKQSTKEVLETAEDLSMDSSDAISIELLSSKYQTIESNLGSEDYLENDWRHLDVTAFLVKEAGSRSVQVKMVFCFVSLASRICHPELS